jgi:peptidoglycan/xylan/chitin deacetylase (PgdA/CDA1 family)
MRKFWNYASRARRHWRKRRKGPIILMYHRVAEPRFDPWGLAVSPGRFDEQLAVLCRRRSPMALQDFMERLQAGKLSRDAVAITFDDGYVDNLRTAKPILLRHGVTATVFLATGSLGQKREFWWDELARMILGRSGGAACELMIDGQTWRVPTLPVEAAADTSWRAWDPPENENQALFVALWKQLRGLSKELRELAMNSVRAAVGAGAADPGDLPMERQDVSELVAGGLIDVGAHTVTHCPLTMRTAEERRHEIQKSKADCEALLGRPVQGFAYPYGDRDSETIAAVRQCGFAWACCTRKGNVRLHDYNPHDLPRLTVMNWRERDFVRAL